MKGLSELKGLSPWNWDSRVEDHPPGLLCETFVINIHGQKKGPGAAAHKALVHQALQVSRDVSRCLRYNTIVPQLQHVCGSTPNKPLWVLQEDGNSARKKQAKVGCALFTKVFRVTWLALLPSHVRSITPIMHVIQ